MSSFGFIIVRSVNSEITNNYWKHSVTSIRKFYPGTPIAIICDNSSPEFLVDDSTHGFENIQIIVSEFPGKGEILGYYYLYKLKLFEKAVVLHDSNFINQYYDYNSIEEHCRFLYHFPSNFHEYDSASALGFFNQCDPLIDYYNKKDKIVGCFGCQSFITWEFLDRLEKEYSFFDILNYIQSRNQRYNMERIFALVCIHAIKYSYHDDLFDIKNISLFGDITKHPRWGMSWETYQSYLEIGYTFLDQNDEPVFLVKVFTGR
jgi:hypothetical protein